MDIQAIAIY